jgi:CRISPR-associated protein Csy2
VKALIEISRFDVQNANAGSGLTWGFPCVSAFLGFVHAIDRKLCANTPFNQVLSGCAIICHDHQTHAIPNEYREYSFSLTRNPVTRDGKTAPFNEEGRMHLSLTLFIECVVSPMDYRDEIKNDPWPDLDEDTWIAKKIASLIPSHRLAGGNIIGDPQVSCHAFNVSDEKKAQLGKKVLIRSLPGFALIDRSELLSTQLEAMKSEDSGTDVIDAWLEFSCFRSRASQRESDLPAQWEHVPVQETGWFIPIVRGFQGIAETQPPNQVASARDPSVPFTPVESIYGVGQWLSPHRVQTIDQLMWRYKYLPSQKYYFENKFTPESAINTGV